MLPSHSKCFICILLPTREVPNFLAKNPNAKFKLLQYCTQNYSFWAFQNARAFLNILCQGSAKFPSLQMPSPPLSNRPTYSLLQVFLQCYHLSEDFPNRTPTLPHPGTSHSCSQLLPLLSCIELITSVSPALCCTTLQVP